MAIIQRPGRSWAVRFSYVNTRKEKKEYFKGGFETEADAQAHEDEMRRGIEQGRKKAAKLRERMTEATPFRVYAETWTETTLRARYRETGFKTEKGRIDNHLIGFLKNRPLRDITKADGEAFKAHLRGRETPLSPSTVNECLMRARWMFEDAVDEGL